MVGVVGPPLVILPGVPGTPKGGCLLEGPSGRLPGGGRSGSAVGCASGAGCPVRWFLPHCVFPRGGAGLLSVSPTFLRG